jgi:hypothetical protein
MVSVPLSFLPSFSLVQCRPRNPSVDHLAFVAFKFVASSGSCRLDPAPRARLFRKNTGPRQRCPCLSLPRVAPPALYVCLPFLTIKALPSDTSPSSRSSRSFFDLLRSRPSAASFRDPLTRRRGSNRYRAPSHAHLFRLRLKMCTSPVMAQNLPLRFCTISFRCHRGWIDGLAHGLSRLREREERSRDDIGSIGLAYFAISSASSSPSTRARPPLFLLIHPPPTMQPPNQPRHHVLVPGGHTSASLQPAPASISAQTPTSFIPQAQHYQPVAGPSRAMSQPPPFRQQQQQQMPPKKTAKAKASGTGAAMGSDKEKGDKKTRSRLACLACKATKQKCDGPTRSECLI